MYNILKKGKKGQRFSRVAKFYDTIEKYDKNYKRRLGPRYLKIQIFHRNINNYL